MASDFKAKLFRQALVITKENDLNDLTPELLDHLLHFVVEVFAKQFTIDDIYDHLDGDELIPLLINTINYVTGSDKPGDQKKM